MAMRQNTSEELNKGSKTQSAGATAAEDAAQQTPDSSSLHHSHDTGAGAAGRKGNDDSNEKLDIKKELVEWVKVLVAAAAIALFLNSFIIANSRIPSASMEDTIMTGDRVIGSRLSYLFSEPERGDIIIFRYPLDEKIYYVKRLIGLPGDTVDIVDGKVYINGSTEPLDEPYLKEEMEAEPSMHFEVPEDCYFFLGDNRNNSLDARYWEKIAMRSASTDPEHDYTFVEKDKLVAKVLFRYYPNLGIVK